MQNAGEILVNLSFAVLNLLTGFLACFAQL